MRFLNPLFLKMPSGQVDPDAMRRAAARLRRLIWPARGRRGRRLAAVALVVPVLAVAGTVWDLGGPDAAAARIRAVLSQAGGNAGLAVAEVLVEGRVRTPPAALLAALDIRHGRPIFELDLPAVRQRVAALPWVKSVRIERRLPDTVYLSIAEHRPLALWRRGGALSLIGRDGTVIALADLEPYVDLPVIAGPGAVAHARAILEALANRPELIRRVTGLTRVGGRRWDLRFDNDVEVRLPEAAPEAAWTRLAALERRHGVLDRDVVSIDLRLPDQMVVRVSPDAWMTLRDGEEDT